MPELLHEAPPQTESLAKTVKIMDRLHAEEVFGTPELSKQFLGSLSFEDFKKLADLVNGVERSIPLPKRGMKGASSIHSTGGLVARGIEYRPPLAQFREPYMENALKKAQSIEDPTTAGLTMAFAINAIHPYPNGNGRAARIMFALLHRGYDGSPEAQGFYTQLLENTKGRDIYDPNPAEHGLQEKITGEMYAELVKSRGYGEDAPEFVLGGYGDVMPDERGSDTLEVSEDISDEARHKLDFILRDGDFTICTLIASYDKAEVLAMTKDANGRRVLDGALLVSRLKESQINDLFNNAVLIKKMYINHVMEFSDRSDADEIVQAYVKQ